MVFPRRLPRILSGVGIAASVALALSASPAAHATTNPSLPSGQTLNEFGWSNQRVATFDPTTGVGTLTYPSSTAGTLGNPEGGGYDASTGITWIMEASTVSGCKLWTVSNTGSLTLGWALQTSTGLSNFNDCWGTLINGDGTAYIFKNSTTRQLIKVNLATGAAIGSPVAIASELSGLSTDPTTGQMWALLPSRSGTPGISKLNPVTGALTDHFDLSTATSHTDPWDMAFDANGRLWIANWNSSGTTPYLASILPTAVSPASTYTEVSPTVGGTVFDADAIWISGTATTPTPAASSSSAALAATGASTQAPLFAAASAALIAGLLGLGFALFSIKKRRAN